jgi:hypothetical protein
MHSTDDRGDGFILFTGAFRTNRALEFRHPAFRPWPGSETVQFRRQAKALASSSTPSGTVPVSTYRQRVMANFRAMATSIMRRILGDCAFVRALYHLDSGLSGCRLCQIHAISIRMRLAQLLPALEIPWHRVDEPLSNALGVNPRYDPRCDRLLNDLAIPVRRPFPGGGPASKYDFPARFAKLLAMHT